MTSTHTQPKLLQTIGFIEILLKMFIIPPWSNHPMIKPPHVHPKGERTERSEVVSMQNTIVVKRC